ncbi:hypothetical protein SGLAM104S_08223 [Streptomyces glaucescens]
MTKRSGWPTMPITANVVGMTPATTMIGPVAASTDSSRPLVPRRSARRARSSPLKVLMPSAPGAPPAPVLVLVLELPVVIRGPSSCRG